MDEPQSDRQGSVTKITILVPLASLPDAALPPPLLEDTRDEWDIMEDYVEDDQHNMCPSCRQIETMELAIGGNGFSEYKCSFCGQQVRLEDDE